MKPAPIVPERIAGYGRRSQVVSKDIVLAIDQSGSMAQSIVYSPIFGAVLATMRSVRTSMVVFDTEVADLTDKLDDPVDVLFGTALGGGTDINRAVAYCQGLITRPTDSIFVLISDLYEGGVEELLRRVATMQGAGVQVIVLLALSDEGAPSFDHDIAGALATMGIPAFAHARRVPRAVGAGGEPWRHRRPCRCQRARAPGDAQPGGGGAGRVIHVS